MQKLSIKALSLVLSLLLMIPVFSVLSFSAGAEATLGDLNGDGNLTQEDIDILAAVLAGTRDADDSVNYDISGNKMVDSDDLIVLKNLVDPSQPALEDKLADGQTDDLLTLVSSAEGGALQRAVVRGDSTKALEVNATGNVTVLFAQPQNWKNMGTLEMDTLWLSGDRTVTVALLGADGQTVLGKPGMVAAQEDGWSRVYVPLSGVAAKDRAEVGGFIVSVAADAHVYLDNLCLVEAPEASVTRADLEAALVEVAWDYHLKGGKVQYDSTELTTRGDVGSEEPMSKAYGGTWRTNTFSTLEDATSDSTVFSVCSDYCWNVYYEALGYPILGHRVNAVTRGLFMNSAYPQNMVVARWWDDGYEFDARWDEFGNTGSERTPAETLLEMITNYETYLRPGDILVAHGNGGHQHAMLYVGGGKILHCGGGKFNLATGVDEVEENGAVHLATVEGTFLNGTEQGGYFLLKDAIADTNVNGAWFVIVRPLDVLTLDDADADAANDKLDLGYVLDTGKLKYELENNDLSPVPTTGFKITDATYSRLQFPGMDIDRTVSVKNYGTVAKGGQLTYTITITNNSNNTDYPTAATAYTGLVVTETVPANTTYVSNVGGGAYAGGKITWTVDVAAGASVTLSYTVTATGNVGDKIVCGGGTVANIPSNVLTTTIGGQKWNAANLEAFLNSDVASGWNSNDGYKISAKAEQETGFAERVYNEVTGLDLQLPGIQELADNLFTQTKIYQPYGLHYFYNQPRTRHMYTLNSREEVAEEYRIYRDMLVEGYFGGVWVYSNDYNKEPRIIDPRAKYLEAGDILVYMNLEGSVSGGTEMEDRKVTTWRVLVYLGSNTYASLESNGRMRKVTGDSPALAGLTYDMFLALRPSQAYEDLNTEIDAYTATAPDLTDADMSYVYRVPASDVLLNDKNAGKLAALTATTVDGVTTEGWTSMNLGFATQVYKKIGLDIYTDGTKGASYATVVLNCFNATSGGWGKAYNYSFRAEPVVGREALHTMVLYYGGTCFNDPVALTSLSQLHVGDVLLMGYRDYSAYLCAVYQGEGKFLVVTQQKEKVTSGKQVTTWFQNTVASDDELAAWLTSAINPSISTWRKYEGYVVLRPSRAYADINAMAIRDLSEGRLTETEKQAISQLTVEQWLADGRSYQLSGFVNWAYKEAKVDASAEMGGKTVNGGHSAIFKKVSGKLTPMTESDSGYNATYAAMLVPGLYGGANVAEHPDRILTAEDLQVGDIFASAKFLSAGSYLFWIGIYQGDGQFLLMEVTSVDKEYKVRVTDTEIIGQDFSQDWMYYYVLRPDWTVIRNMEDGALTAEELLAIGNFRGGEAVRWYDFAKSVYSHAGITLSVCDKAENYNKVRGYLIAKGGAIVAATEDTQVYHDMFLPEHYGGNLTNIYRAFVPADFKVGDLFLTAGAKCTCNEDTTLNKYPYVTGVYLGEGKFRVARFGCTVCSDVYVDEYGKELENGYISLWSDATTMYDSFEYYFVLRPERLADDALQSIAISESTLNLSVGATATLTVTKTPETATSVIWVSSDESIAKVEDGVVTAIRGGTCTITAYVDGYSAICTVTVPYRAIASGALTAEEMQAIASLTSLTAGKNPGVVAKQVYDAAGVDISAVLKNQSFNDVYTAVTATTTSDHTKILVPGYSGGSQLTESRSFTPNDLKVGDLFMAYAPNHCDDCTSANTLTAVYIGNGRFLVADKNTCATCGGCYIDDYADAASNAYSIWGDVTALNSTFTKYFVLRPERLAPDALQSISLDQTALTLKTNETATLAATKTPNVAAAITWVSSDEDIATVDANGKVTPVAPGTCTITAYCDGNSASCEVTVTMRAITDGALTEREMAAFDEFTVGTKTLSKVAGDAYTTVGITGIYDLLGKQNSNGMRTQLINTDGTLVTTESNYTKMLVPGLYGGSVPKTGKTFVPADLKPGDIFGGVSTACDHQSYNYVAAIYLGNETFQVVQQRCTECTVSYLDIKGETFSTSATKGHSTVSLWTEDAAELESVFSYYFVLRPERLAADALQGIALSDDGMSVALNKTTTITVTKDPLDAAPNATVTWVSSDPDVATVVDGKVTALSVGRATITAYCDGCSATCVVAVVGRDIADGAMTAEEMEAIKSYWPEQATTVGPIMKDAYALAEIDLNPAIGSPSYGDIREALFASNGTLLETPANANYGKMLMPGYYGGSRRFASEGTVGKIFTPDDFKIGDTFIAALDQGHDGLMWVYITGIYVGNGKFVIAETHTNANCTDECKRVYYSDYNTENADKAVVWGDEEAMKVYRYYFVLRPERLAADALQGVSLNKTELTLDYTAANSLPAANAETLTITKDPAAAADPVNVVWSTSNPDVATVVDGKITAVGAGTCTITVNCDGYTATCEVTITRTADARGSLTATEQAAIQSFDGSDNTAFATFAKAAYTAAGIDINPVFAKYGFYDLARKNFDVDGETYALLEESALTEEQAKFREMLIYDYYGGSKISVGKTFTADSFEIGDLFFAVRKCPTTNAGGLYIAGVYQGNGKFRVYEHHPAGCGGTCRSVFTDEKGVTEDTVVWGTSAEMKTIQYYFVLRPSRLAMRLISDGALTAAEQAAIEKYSRDEVGGTLSQVAIEAYTQAGIVVDFTFGKSAVSDARKALINESTGLLIEGTTAWHKMLVEGYYGGYYNATRAEEPTGKTFAPDSFQVGDIFCGISKCSTCTEGKNYWPATTAVYVGNGKFIVAKHTSCECAATYTDDVEKMDGTGLLEENGLVSIWATDVEALNGAWLHYFVLRPSQLAQ